MSYPVLEINLRKLQYNAQVEVESLSRIGIEVMGVNKVFNGSLETARAIYQGGIRTVAESRIENLKKIRSLPCAKALLRSPAPSEITETVQFADISLNSEMEIIRALSEEACRQKKTHQVLLMVDMGDLREGIWYENTAELEQTTEQLLQLPNLEIYGIGTNFNCYGTVMPSVENCSQLVRIARMLEEKFNFTFKYISGGNCTTFHLIDKGMLPPGINHLRIGGQHQFGIEYVEEKYLEGYYHSSMPISRFTSDLYILKAEIIETNSKPTVPVGKLGTDCFLQSKSFTDRGTRRRALLAVGLQDIPSSNIHPLDKNIQIMGQTSDHTLIDIEDCRSNYRTGDIISFEIDYTALLAACNSPGIQKKYIRD